MCVGRLWPRSCSFVFDAIAVARNQPIDASTRTLFDTIVTRMPRLAITGGVLLLAIDVYFKRQRADAYQVIDQLGELRMEHWREQNQSDDHT